VKSIIATIKNGFNLRSESIFAYSLKKDISIGALIVGTFLVYFLINNTPASIPTNLNINDVNALDRWLIFPYNEWLDRIKFIFLAVLLVLPIISPLVINMRSKGTLLKYGGTWLTYGVMYAQALLFATGARGILKSMILRYRPYMYFDGMEAMRDFDRSFPSGTAISAFLPATFFSVTFAAEFPNSRWKIPVIVGSHIFAAVAGGIRIYNGTHFLTDVLAGAAIGSFLGWLIPMLHKKTKTHKEI